MEHQLGWSTIPQTEKQTGNHAGALTSIDSSVGGSVVMAAPNGGVQLPPTVIAAFLEAQQREEKGRPQKKGRALTRWLRNILIAAGAAGLVAGGAALGRTIHAHRMASLDDRNTLARRVDSLAKQLARAEARVVATDAAQSLQREALEAAHARGAALAAEAMEVGRLNRALQLRLEKAEAKLERDAAALQQAEARIAALKHERSAA